MLQEYVREVVGTGGGAYAYYYYYCYYCIFCLPLVQQQLLLYYIVPGNEGSCLGPRFCQSCYSCNLGPQVVQAAQVVQVVQVVQGKMCKMTKIAPVVQVFFGKLACQSYTLCKN